MKNNAITLIIVIVTYVRTGADFDFLILFPAAAAALRAVSSASPSTTQFPSLTIQFSVHKASVNSELCEIITTPP